MIHSLEFDIAIKFANGGYIVAVSLPMEDGTEMEKTYTCTSIQEVCNLVLTFDAYSLRQAALNGDLGLDLDKDLEGNAVGGDDDADLGALGAP